MALIRCKECNKQVSDKAASCPGCGAPIGGSSAMGNIAFEKRIDQYKANGYKITKRNGDEVKMQKFNIIGWIIVVIVASIWFVFCMWYVGTIVAILTMCAIIFIYLSTQMATITLTKTGRIEESGKTLKK